MNINKILIGIVLILISFNVKGQRVFSNLTTLGEYDTTTDTWVTTNEYEDSKFLEFNKSFTLLTIIDKDGEAIYRITAHTIIEKREILANIYSEFGIYYELTWFLEKDVIAFELTLDGKDVVILYNVMSIQELD